MKMPVNFKLDRPSAIFLVLVCTLLLEAVVFLPLAITKIRKLNREIVAMRVKLSNFKRDWPKKDQYIKENINSKEQIRRINQKFFLPRQEASVLSFISSESKKFNVTIELMKPAEVKEKVSNEIGVFESLPVIVKATAKFHNLVRFLDYLQNSKYFFEVKKLDIFSGDRVNSIDIEICGLIKE